MGLGNKEVFAKNLKGFIAKSGKDRREVAKDLDLPYSTLTDWVNGNKYPRINNIEKLAVYFEVSKADLIENFEEKIKDNERLATVIVQLRMNEEFLDAVYKMTFFRRG